MDPIKQVSQNVYEANHPTDAIVATVMEVDPVRIQLDGYAGMLPAAVIDIPDYLDIYDVKIPDGELSSPDVTGILNGEEHDGNLKLSSLQGWLRIDNRLKVGDRIHVIKKQGGQKYLVIGRVVE